MERSVKGAITIVAGGISLILVAVFVFGLVVPTVRTFFQPCRGRMSRCVDEAHLEICGDVHVIGRCAKCTGETDCELIAEPAAGNVCSNGGFGGTGYRALPEQSVCSKDKRSMLDCAGGMNVWTEKRCKDDEECHEPNMGICDKKR